MDLKDRLIEVSNYNQFRKVLQTKDQIIDKLRKEVNQLENKPSEQEERLRKEVCETQAKLSDADRENKSLRNQLNEANVKIEDMYTKINSHFDEILSLKAMMGAVENSSPFEKKEEIKKIKFAGEKHPLSNWYHIKEGLPVRFGEPIIVFGSTEEAFMYQCAIDAKDTKAAEDILKTRNGRKAHEIGKAIKKSENWTISKEEQVMKTLLFLKVEHCKEFKDFLKKSEDAKLIEDTKNTVWGAGLPNKPGRNLMGKLLEEVRGSIDHVEEDVGSAVEVSSTTSASEDFQFKEKELQKPVLNDSRYRRDDWQKRNWQRGRDNFNENNQYRRDRYWHGQEYRRPYRRGNGGWQDGYGKWRRPDNFNNSKIYEDRF